MRWRTPSPALTCLVGALGLACLAACEPTDDLAADAVTTFPDGDAVGSALSGAYLIAFRTMSCDGPCQYYSPLYGTSHYCEPGEQQLRIEIKQTDGHLELKGSYLNPGMRVARLAGGLDSRGHFEVGGVGADEPSAATMRLQGAFGAAGLTATGRARLRRPNIGECLGSYHLSGARGP